jgi:hypothetical protein
MAKNSDNFKCLCADCPNCGKELIESLAYSHRKYGINEPTVITMRCSACSHDWQLTLCALTLRLKTRVELETFGGQGVFGYR